MSRSPAATVSILLFCLFSVAACGESGTAKPEPSAKAATTATAAASATATATAAPAATTKKEDSGW